MSAEWSSRKLWVALLGMALASLLRWRGVIADESWVTVMLAAMLGYPAANVAQQVVTGKQSTSNGAKP